jgi:hypothetical protein
VSHPLATPECTFCRTNSKAEPCSKPGHEHRAGFHVWDGPDRFGNFSYTYYWWREDVKRSRAQCFASRQHLDMPEFKEALARYRIVTPEVDTERYPVWVPAEPVVCPTCGRS